MQDNIELSKAAVQRLGLEMVVVKAGSEGDIESAIAAAVQQQAKALSIGNDAYLSSRSRQIAFFALRHVAFFRYLQCQNCCSELQSG